MTTETMITMMDVQQHVKQNIKDVSITTPVDGVVVHEEYHVHKIQTVNQDQNVETET